MGDLKNIVDSVLAGFQNPENQPKQKLWNEWPKIVGENLAQHTRPSLTKDKTLFVWVDQSALAFELNQKYRQVLLKRVQAAVGEEIKSVYFRVGQLR